WAKFKTCYNCGKKGDLKRCAGCQHAYYCSKACQKQHWRRHKPNCIPPESSLHELFQACFTDLFPSPSTARDYGFDNVKLYHGDGVIKSWNCPRGDLVLPDGSTAKNVLLGVYQFIAQDIANTERPEGWLPVKNSIGASMKMMHEAFEKNALDEFLHRYINSLGNHLTPESYCYGWIKLKLVIGPTRLSLSDSVQLTKEQVEQMRSDIYRRYYGAEQPMKTIKVIQIK
ncbi:hypothetical protein ACROYT_G033135, partial [Oculina patagonica]